MRRSNNNDTLQNRVKATSYGNIIWGPHYQADIKALESIQRRATKLVFSLKEMDYEERLRELKLPSLVYRRQRGDMIQMYKIMNGLVRMNINALFTPAKVRSTRGHFQKLFKYHATKHSRVNSFTQCVINDWNNLPTNVTNAPSLNIFKNRLDEFWEHLH